MSNKNHVIGSNESYAIQCLLIDHHILRMLDHEKRIRVSEVVQ